LTLASATLIALVWANAAGDGYRRAGTTTLSWLRFTGLELSARDWVNHGLMTCFFVLVGLEIRREMRAGELGTWRRASGPIIAAIAGMAAPALLYALIVHDGPGGHGWGIPMATDVAFALGALALAGSHASRRWRLFLMTLAVADDILAIAVLVVIYSARFDAVPASVGAACLVAMAIVRARRAGTAIPVAFAAIAWWCLARAGLEAEIVGVAIGLAGLAGPRHGPRAWERRLQPAVSLLVLPAFALANTGVELAHLDLGSKPALRLFVAVLVARLIGKPLGIGLAAGAVVQGGRIRDRVGVGLAASVGFTVPLLIVRASFGEGPLAESATTALLASTAIGAVMTFSLLRPRRGPGE